jgi:cell division protein FtsL
MGVVGPIAVASLFAVLLAMAALQALIVQGQTRLDRLDRDVTEAVARRDRLGLQLAELESPDRIVAEARRLGMVDAPVVVYLTPTRPAASMPELAPGAGTER